MGGFDLKTAVQAVPKMVDDLTELAKNGQDNKTKRYESDNKRAVELKKEGTQKILAAGQVVNNIGSPQTIWAVPIKTSARRKVIWKKQELRRQKHRLKSKKPMLYWNGPKTKKAKTIRNM